MTVKRAEALMMQTMLVTTAEAGYGAQAGDVASQLAVHFERGGEIPRAVYYWQQAGENATRRNAYHEAIAALRKGLALLATLPDSPERTQCELTLQLTLGELLMAAKGMISAEAGEAYTRAHMLCQQLGETRQLFQALSGLCLFHCAQARLRTGREFGQQLFNLAQRQRDPVLVREGHLLMGATALYRGDLVVARTHLEQSLEISAAEPPSTSIFAAGLHPRIASRVWLVRALWVLGYADQARQRSRETMALARQAGDTPSLSYAEYFVAMLYQYRHDVVIMQACAEAVMALAEA
jgi:tetratricopeptide (TPR) repeat protein